ncbi:glycosyltransferase family 2 protein [Occultella gossypii]|uniref:Glycosyltransferase family 2 protein n=1 Tax=Occultella gossypii TaxID=2800820 RepID=A0ABS7S9K1_9MICO|nr:glycosyltransferase family 2 protein [Occultella gossypii]MBZ2196435.1 glycosyltransferase family 2 protein [Occultella gossypii]
MPAYNAEATVGAAIGSVLAQTHTDWELLVTDDGSSDGTGAVLAEAAAADERIRPGRTAGRAGAAGARNEAIGRATGDYIAFLDADDLWLPTKLERQLAFAEAGDVPLTFSSYYKVAADFDDDPARWRPNGRIVRARDRLDYRAMLQQNHIGCLTAMYDRRTLGTRYMPDLRKRQDYALWLSILRDGGEARGLAEPLALYRDARADSLSANKLSLVRYNWQLYRDVEKLSLPRSLWALGQTTVRSVLKGRI